MRFKEKKSNMQTRSSWGHKESDMTEWLNWTDHAYIWKESNRYTEIKKLIRDIEDLE